MTIHFTACVCLDGDDDIEVNVQADMTRGSPETGPTYDSGGTPADPGSCEILSVTRADGKQPVELLPEIRIYDAARRVALRDLPAKAHALAEGSIEERLEELAWDQVAAEEYSRCADAAEARFERARDERY